MSWKAKIDAAALEKKKVPNTPREEPRESAFNRGYLATQPFIYVTSGFAQAYQIFLDLQSQGYVGSDYHSDFLLTYQPDVYNTLPSWDNANSGKYPGGLSKIDKGRFVKDDNMAYLIARQ